MDAAEKDRATMANDVVAVITEEWFEARFAPKLRASGLGIDFESRIISAPFGSGTIGSRVVFRNGKALCVIRDHESGVFRAVRGDLEGVAASGSEPASDSDAARFEAPPPSWRWG